MHIFHTWKYIEPGFDYRGCYWTEKCSTCLKERDVVMPALLWTQIGIVKATEHLTKP